MSPAHQRTSKLLAWAVTLGLLAGALSAAPARADDAGQDAGKLCDSLKLVPADASVYGAMLRNKEQIDAIAHSKAWAKLTALPLVKMARQKIEEDLGKEGGPL